MKTTIRLLLLAALAVFSLAFAAPNITLTDTVVSDYMFRGQKLAGLSTQPAIDVAVGNLDLGVWNSTTLARTAFADPSLEFDFYGSYSQDVGMGVSLVPGFTYYTYPRAITKDGAFRSTFEPNLGVSFSLGSVKVTPKAYYDVTLKSLTSELGATYALPLKSLGTELDLSATAGTYKGTDTVNAAGPATKAWGSYWLAGVNAPFQITKSGKLVLGYAYTTTWQAFAKTGRAHQTPQDTAGRSVWSANYNYSF